MSQWIVGYYSYHHYHYHHIVDIGNYSSNGSYAVIDFVAYDASTLWFEYRTMMTMMLVVVALNQFPSSIDSEWNV